MKTALWIIGQGIGGSKIVEYEVFLGRILKCTDFVLNWYIRALLVELNYLSFIDIYARDFFMLLLNAR